MFVRIAIGLLSLSWALQSSGMDVERPADLKLVPPSADVPEPCATFFSATGWGKAKWDSGRSGELWVETISPDCTAQVVYVFGPLGKNPGGHARVSGARIEGRFLAFVLTLEHQGREVVADVRYEAGKAHSDGRPLLFGSWRGRSGGQTFITLEKGAP